jgi:transcriptional regulator with XRE-family HTH domain/Tol biopolymer transport system component
MRAGVVLAQVLCAFNVGGWAAGCGLARGVEAVTEQPGLSFAGLLRQLRAEAKLTQEELAEAASLSPRSVSDLERGISRTARKDTAVLLAGALGLAGPAGELFVAAARGKAPATEALAAVRGAGPQGPAIASPYRGLHVFEEQDAAFFFGREAAATALLDRMSRLLGALGLLVVSGVSGAGKSSLLRAGVLPRIREAGLAAAPEAASWPCLVFTPTRVPLDELALRVAALAGADAAAVRQGLDAAPAWFALTARQAALARPPGPAGDLDGPVARRDQPPRQQRLLMVVDQFEEIFTQCADEGQRRAFITALHAAGSAGHGPDQMPAALVMLGVRADFEARCADYPQLAGPVQDRYLVTSMTERQLRMAISEPAKKAGSKVDDDLTGLLLTEVRNSQPGSFGAGVLPLLSHALDQAWRCRAGAAVTLADYERAGGLEGAVTASAQRAYDRLTSAQQAAARQVFLRLTATSSDGVDTAARATRVELTGGTSAAQAQDVEAVLEAFAAERLITLAADTVEISHEALLTAWPLLRDTWLADTHADRIVRTRLDNSAAEWARHSRDSSYLYSGSLLQAAADTAARISADPARHPPLSQTERDFLHASDHARRRRARRRQGLIVLLGVLVIGFASATVVAVRAGQQATRQLHVVSSGLLINESRLIGDADPALSKLLSVAAWRINPSSAARSAMLAAAARPGIAILGGYSEPVVSVAFSPDGKTLATGDTGGAVQLWAVAARQPIGVPLIGQGAPVNSAAFSPDSKTLATGDAVGTVRLWAVATGLPIGIPLSNGHASVIWVAFSPDGKTLAAGDGVGAVRLWDVATRQPTGAPFSVDAGQVTSMALGPDGKTLATGSADGKVRLWDMATRHQLQLGQPSIGQGGPINSVAFSPDGKTLASGSGNDTAQLWDTATRQPTGLPLIDGQDGSIDSVAFSPDGKTLAAGDADDTVRLWSVAARVQIGGPLTGHGGPVTAVAFGPDGKTLASGSYDGTARLWNVAMPSQNLAEATNLVRYLCALAGPSLTRSEWAQYVPNLAYQTVCP